MKRFTVLKKKSAQQLVEFLLVAPFIMIFLGILTEYAYALNINMTLTEGLKTATSSIYRDIKPGMTASDVQTIVFDNLKAYLDKNNAPVLAENIKAENVGYASIGQNTVFMASYTYIPAFTLPNVWVKIMPSEFKLFATAAVPTAFLSANNYDATLTSSKLDGIWSSSGSFTKQTDFDASKKGIMKDTEGRNNMIFLVPTSAPNLTNPYALVGWDGAVKMDGSSTYAVDTKDGQLYTCPWLGNCTATGRTFLDDAKSKSYYNIIFIHDSALSGISNLSTQWLDPPGTVDLTGISVQGVLKRALALFDLSSNLSIGNYDNLDVFLQDYNPIISKGNTYTVTTFGSMVFVGTTTDTSKITVGTESAYGDAGRW